MNALVERIPELDRTMTFVSGKRVITVLDLDHGDWLVIRLPHGNRRHRRGPGVFSAPGNTRREELAQKIQAIWAELVSATVTAA
jgi:hypothetical protein